MVVIGLLIGLLVCAAPIIVITLIITAIVKRNKEDKNNFDETVRNIYVYIILIITLIAITVGTIAVIRIGLDVILPEKSLYESSYSNDRMEMNENIIELCTTAALVVSVIPIFVYHNGLVQKSREKNAQEIKFEEINN